MPVPGHQACSEPGAHGQESQEIWKRHRGEYTWAVYVFVLLFGHNMFCLGLALVLALISFEDWHRMHSLRLVCKPG